MRNIITSAILAVTLTATQPGFADTDAGEYDEAVEAAHRINIAGRQRMLSQRISKAACFVSAGVDVAAQQIILDDAFRLFSASHEALRFGSEEMRLSSGGSQNLLDALETVNADFEEFAVMIEAAISTGYVSRPALERIDETGLVLLYDMNKAVASSYGEMLPDMPLIFSLTIDLAGRQRMLTQEAAKEFCLIDAGVDVAANREKLGKSVELFSRTLGLLIDGAPGMIMPAPTDEIRTQLELVLEAWQAPKTILEQAAAGAEISEAQRLAIVNEMDRLMVLMNEAVNMYEEPVPSQS